MKKYLLDQAIWAGICIFSIIGVLVLYQSSLRFIIALILFILSIVISRGSVLLLLDIITGESITVGNFSHQFYEACGDTFTSCQILYWQFQLENDEILQVIYPIDTKKETANLPYKNQPVVLHYYPRSKALIYWTPIE